MFTLPLLGSGTEDDPYKISLQNESWTENGDGTATVTLAQDMALRVRNFAATAAGELNSGTPWTNMTAIQPEGLPLTLVKQDLVDNVKLTYNQGMNQEGGITSGDVVAHDNATTKGLWRADVDTTAEPTKDSSDWTLVFEITV
jgi:hypothetical protein